MNKLFGTSLILPLSPAKVKLNRVTRNDLLRHFSRIRPETGEVVVILVIKYAASPKIITSAVISHTTRINKGRS
jgi:hypothetical protein